MKLFRNNRLNLYPPLTVSLASLLTKLNSSMFLECLWCGECRLRGCVVATDHPVHAPPSTTSPWESELPPTKGYVMAPVRGVYHVYRNQAALEAGDPIPYAFPNLDVFVADMNRLCTMISDGPM